MTPRIPKVKIIIVTGGVLSGLGKGVTAASLGRILQSRGLEVNILKFDPYLNVDAGTLNPGEHGEVFVTEDGGEADLDLGHYERFLNKNLRRTSSVMAGQILRAVLDRERRGEFLGRTVQIIPHVTDEIKARIYTAARSSRCQIQIVEIGGTVGDYEGMHFLEAARQMLADVGRENIAYVHVVFLPYLTASQEVKTKPAQNSVRDLLNIGIQPDVLVARSDYPIHRSKVYKLAQFTNVRPEAIIALPTLSSMYEVPLLMRQAKLDLLLLRHFGLRKYRGGRDRAWEQLVRRIRRTRRTIRIALVGKYMDMRDTYMSLVEAIRAAAWAHSRQADIWWVDAEEIEKGRQRVEELAQAAGVIVPGGFGKRGIEGKIFAIEYARQHQIPFLGLCLGMQLAVVEFARHVARLPHAHSEEFAEEEKAKTGKSRKYPRVIHLMHEQRRINQKGGTMRLGSWPCVLTRGTKTHAAYGCTRVQERHRHRYEFNNAWRTKLERAGLVIAGTTPDRKLVEIIELKNHPWFVGVQFHPEFTSRPLAPHPLFMGFMKAALCRERALKTKSGRKSENR
jgi:CTP synthase